MNYDKIYIINLEHRKDRREHIIKELKKVSIDNYVIFKAIKPETEDDINKWNKNFCKERADWLKNAPDEYYLKYRLGSLGCLQSHYEILKDAEENNYNNIIILEDDAFFRINTRFEELIKILINQSNHIKTSIDIFYFGGRHNKQDYEKISENIVKVKSMATTTAYLINKETRKYIIENIQNNESEIDCYYSNVIQNKFNCYSVIPSIICQSSGFSDIVQRNVSYNFDVIT